MKRLKIAGVLVAPMLLLACSGPAPETGLAPSVPAHIAPAAETVTSLTSAEAQSVLEASVKDRIAEALAASAPVRPSLAAAKSSDKFKATREHERLLAAEGRLRFQGFGFHYTSAVATVRVVEVMETASRATVRFDEFGTQYLASDTNGPSDVPEQYRVHASATFLPTDHGWVLDEVLPDDGQFGLPFSMVDPRRPPDAAARP